MAIPLPHRRFTVDEYEQMLEMGLFDEDERIELLDGEIIEMPPPGLKHVLSINALTRLLVVALLDEDVDVSVQNPVRLARGVPLPDLAVYRRKRYTRLPAAEDVPLILEVADSTITTDRRIKFPRYAAAGIAEAWLVDINAETVERHTEPRGDSYGVVVVARRGESLPSVVFPSLVLDVDMILGPEADGK